MKSTRTFVMALITAGLLVVAGNVMAADKPDLSGRWKLNKDLSDNPSEKMKEAQGSSHGSGGERGERGGGGGMHGGHRGHGGPGENARPGGDPYGISTGLITITQTDAAIIIEGGERERVLRTDGRVEQVDTPRGGQMEISSKWEEDGFVVTMKDEMHTTTETWSIDPLTHRLVVNTEIERGGDAPKITIRKVWDKVDEAKTSG